MFKNIFKSNRNQKLLESHLEAFNETFNQKQKEAIFYSIALMIMIDDEISTEEKEFFHELSLLLNFKFDLQNHAMPPDKMYQILKTLTNFQLDWYIVTIYGLINADGKIDPREVNGFIEILDELGVDYFEAMDTIQKAALFNEQFG